MSIQLSKLKPGTTAIIVGFDEDRIPLKILEMGMLPGYEVQVKQLSPLGDPMHIRVAGADMALRKDEADMVLVDIETIKPAY